MTVTAVNLKDPDWQTTHAGRPYNHKYGYGKLDAYRIVELARTWELVKPQAWFQVAKQEVDKALTKDGIVSSIDITQDGLDAANFQSLEHVTVTIKAKHSRRGDMEVYLDSPNGVRSILARRRRFDDDTSGYPDWTFMSVKHWDEDPVGKWTVTIRDRMDNGKNGTFVNWSMMLWGQSKDASIAVPYKMNKDAQIHLPTPPHHKSTSNLTLSTITHTDGGSTWLETTTLVAPMHETTKSYARPTAHLPGDHGDANGESDHPLDGTMEQTASSTLSETSTSASSESASATSPAQAEEEEDVEDTKYLGPWSSLVDDSTWFYIAIGSVIIFLGAAGAWLLLRRRQLAGGYGGGRRIGNAFGGLFRGYGLLSGRDDDDTHPMSALERGRGVSRNGGGGAGRTRALYDAFALDSSEDEDEDTGGYTDEVRRGAGRQGQESRSLVRGAGDASGRSPMQERMDDSYMSSFLGDGDEDDDEQEEHEEGEEGRRAAASSSVPASGRQSPRHSTPALVDTGDDDENKPLVPSP